MAEYRELETLVYCVGPVGGPDNPVISHTSDFTSKYDYTTRGYARYIKEARDLIKYQTYAMNYFLDSVKSEFETDPLEFIDAETKEELVASIQMMKKQWKEMFKDHQKNLRDSLRKQREAYELSSDDSSSSSSAKMFKLDPEATGGATCDGGMPVDQVNFLDSIYVQRVNAFFGVVKDEFKKLRTRLGKALDDIIPDNTSHDLKGFSLKRMEKFAKWKYSLKTLNHLVSELENIFGELDLDLKEIKPHETRLTRWMFFDDGEKDRQYHHRLLIPMDLTNSVAEMSTLAYKQLQRWLNISSALRKALSEEYEKLLEKKEEWRLEISCGIKMGWADTPQESFELDDTYNDTEDISEETQNP